MTHLDPSHHIFRYVGGSMIDGDFIEPAAFRRTVKGGRLEAGLSVNWVEYFQKSTPREAIPQLRDVFLKKGRTIGATSKFALLNVAAAKAAAMRYAAIAIVLDQQPNDPSHSLIKDYEEALNDQVAEQLQKVIMASYPAAAGR